MRTLRTGSKGQDVIDWQNFLRGLNLYLGPVDGDFGNGTKSATIEFQKQFVVPTTGSQYDADGIVGNNTYSVAAAKFGFKIIDDDDDDDKYGPNWPPPPNNLKPLSAAEKDALFGKIEYVANPLPNNPEHIKITNNWQRENLGRVKIPQLIGVEGAPKDGVIFWHKKGVDQIKALFDAWEKAGLNDRILTWAGSWVPRFVRGSRTTLSNHSIATAFDINAAWNGLGRQPALLGRKGCIRELVPIANDLGFFNGLHFRRQDGMHFELVKI